MMIVVDCYLMCPSMKVDGSARLLYLANSVLAQ